MFLWLIWLRSPPCTVLDDTLTSRMMPHIHLNTLSFQTRHCIHSCECCSSAETTSEDLRSHCFRSSMILEQFHQLGGRGRTGSNLNRGVLSTSRLKTEVVVNEKSEAAVLWSAARLQRGSLWKLYSYTRSRIQSRE